MPTPTALHDARARVRRWFAANPALFTPEQHQQMLDETDACTDLEQLAAMEQAAMQHCHERLGVTV